MDWFSSDWHLGHENIIRICDRPFSSADEMDKTIMGNMLSVMKRKDTLYFLGDLSFSQSIAYEALTTLFNHGINVVWVLGNHDRHCSPEKLGGLYKEVGYSSVYKKDGIVMHLSHFPMRVWFMSFRNAWNLYGHVHTMSPELDFLEQPPYGKSLNVNLEFHDYMPYSLDEVVEIMRNKPDNVDYLLLEKRRREQANKEAGS